MGTCLLQVPLAAPRSSLRFTTLTAGGHHSCGLTASGAAFCWGANRNGQLGTGDTISRGQPAPVAGGLRYVALAAGDLHTCGLTAGGAIYCWGSNRGGYLGTGGTADHWTPVPVRGRSTFTALSVQGGRSCAIATGGSAFCWGGSSDEDILGEPPDTEPTLVAGGLRFSAISAGDVSACGLSASGLAYCWGDNSYSQLGNGDSDVSQSKKPSRVAGGIRFAAVVHGAWHACGLTAAGRPYCWGLSTDLGVGSTDSSARASPVPVATRSLFKELTASSHHTCGLTASGGAYCWGNNDDGELGSGTRVRGGTAQIVSGGISFALLSAGDRHTCGLAIGGAAYCWGSNEDGQLGTGTTEGSLSPVAVLDSSARARELVDIPALHARVTSVRFFEGGARSRPLEERVYAEQFDSAVTRYVYFELGLSHPAPGRQLEATVLCRYLGPQGDVDTMTAVVTIQADWISTYHATGAGWEDRGNWSPGTYTLECNAEGGVFVRRRFEIVVQPPDIRSFNAHLAELRFFEWGDSVPAPDQRTYATTFPGARTRHIGAEVDLVFPAPGRIVRTPLSCVFSHGNYSWFGKTDGTIEIPADWTSSMSWVSLGWPAPGNWAPDTYHVDCSVEGQVIARRSFKVQ